MITVYMDCDDTILNSSAAIIEILNEKYGVNKTLKDLRDYKYRSIVGTVAQEEILEIFQSEQFWQKVQFNEQFVEVIKKLKNNFKFVVISKGTKENLESKEAHLKKAFKQMDVDIDFVGIPILLGSKTKFEKSLVDMTGAIQIDDCTSELNTKAAIRILLRNGRRVEWNYIPWNEENFYGVDTWKEIEEILEFAAQSDEFMARAF